MKENKNKFLGIMIMVVIVEFFGMANAALFAQAAPRSFYVAANGNDENNGRSEEQAFKTLAKAVDAAKMGVIKRITVIGKITSGIDISNTGADEILVTGKPDAAEGEKAEITLLNERHTFRISQMNVRFTYVSLPKVTVESKSIIILGAGALVSEINIKNSDNTLTMTDNAVVHGISTISNPGRRLESIQIIMSDNATVTGGMGIACWGATKTTITMSGNARIVNNTRDGNSGGGINVDGESVITMSDNAEISGNTARNDGGGIYGQNVTLTMSGNARIVNNTSNGGNNGAGGGIYGENLTLTMSDNARITNNTSRRNGGGIYAIRSIITISDNAQISGNTAHNDGGGICIIYNGKLTINGGEISGNTAERGGGVFTTGNNEVSMTGGIVTGNKAEYGAGVFVGKGGSSTFKGGSITGNEAEFVGGGVYVENGATYTAEGGTVTDNTAGDGGSNVFRQQ
jgi:predicted outer membrane repeat protein